MLVYNGTTLSSLPIRFLGGDPGTLRPFYNRFGRTNFTVGSGVTNSKAGIPNGHLAPSAWVLPRSPGEMSAFVNTALTMTGEGSGAMGVNGTATATITFSENTSLQLVVSGSGEASISLTGSADLIGTALIAGSVGATLDNGTPVLTALADIIANSPVNISGSATARADGFMAGDITPYTTLSPENLATAVKNISIETGYTLGDILKILSAVAAGKTTIVDLGGGNATVTFRNLGDSLDRLVADMTGSQRTSITTDLG